MSKIVMLVEGRTESALKPALKEYLDGLPGASERRVRLEMKPLDSDLFNQAKLRFRIRENLKSPEVLGVVALVDVKGPKRFSNAQEAIAFLQECHPSEDRRFRPHAAQFEVEAWLLPFWGDLCKRLKVNSQAPAANPEAVNHDRPPSHHLSELYRKAKPSRRYDKVRDAPTILTAKNLPTAAKACPQLGALLRSLEELASWPAP